MQIKFRAWIPSWKRWIQGDELDDACLTQGGVLRLHEGYGEFSSQEDAIVQLFTGVVDKNGKEIYEGDIIHMVREEVSERGEFNDHTLDIEGKVVYERGAFLLEITPYVKEYLRDISVDHWTMRKFEVVGNGYSN